MDRTRHQVQQRHQQHSTRHDTSTAALDTSDNTDYPDLHIVFEFFTDNPQKTMPTDTNSPQKDSPYYDPYWDAIRSMQSNENFLEGMLLRCVDCNRKQCQSHSVTISCIFIHLFISSAAADNCQWRFPCSLLSKSSLGYLLASLVISPNQGSFAVSFHDLCFN